MEKCSKSSQEEIETEPLSGTNTLEVINTDSEFKTTNQKMEDNGGCSTREPRPSELIKTETRLSLLYLEATSMKELFMPQSPETMRHQDHHSKELDSSQEHTRTSKTMVTNVLKLEKPRMYIIDTYNGQPDVKMDGTSPGILTQKST